MSRENPGIKPGPSEANATGDELKLEPGWLARDVEAASKRVEEWRAANSAGQEPVAIKQLEWRDHRPDSFPEPAWSAQTPFGFYNIEEVSASDCPAYVVRLHAHHFIADKDSLDDAKAAAQQHYEKCIRSALYTAPPVTASVEEVARIIDNCPVAYVSERGDDPLAAQIDQSRADIKEAILALLSRKEGNVTTPPTKEKS